MIEPGLLQNARAGAKVTLSQFQDAVRSASASRLGRQPVLRRVRLSRHAFDHDRGVPGQPGESVARRYLAYPGLGELPLPFNLSQNPAVSVPVGLSDGLPVGLQIVGDRYADVAVLELARQLERQIGVLPAPPNTPL